MWARCAWRWVTCVNRRKRQRSKVLSFKAQVTNHTQSAACPNSSVAVLFDGPLQKFLLRDRPLPAWRLIIAVETISLKRKAVHSGCGTPRDLRRHDLMFTVISTTTLRPLYCKWGDNVACLYIKTLKWKCDRSSRQSWDAGLKRFSKSEVAPLLLKTQNNYFKSKLEDPGGDCKTRYAETWSKVWHWH